MHRPAQMNKQSVISFRSQRSLHRRESTCVICCLTVCIRILSCGQDGLNGKELLAKAKGFGCLDLDRLTLHRLYVNMIQNNSVRGKDWRHEEQCTFSADLPAGNKGKQRESWLKCCLHAV